MLWVAEFGLALLVEAFEHLEQEHADVLALSYDELVGGEVHVDACLLGEHEEVGADGVGFVLLVKLGVGVGHLVQRPEGQVHEDLELFVALLVRGHSEVVVPQDGLALAHTELALLVTQF